jgi:hypothetical protein
LLWADLVDCDGKNRPTGPEISETGHADLLIKFTLPTQMLHIAHIFIFSFLVFEKKNCEFAELRLNGLFRNVVVVSNLQ